MDKIINKIRNFTGRDITIISPGSEIKLPCEGRVELLHERNIISMFYKGDEVIPVKEYVTYKQIGLPDPEPGVYIIVSPIVYELFSKTRDDLLISEEPVKSGTGKVIAYKSVGMRKTKI